MSFFFLIFFQKIKKKKLISFRRGFKKPFERADFDFLIFFCKKKIKKSKSALSAPSFSGEKRSPKFPALSLFVMHEDRHRAFWAQRSLDAEKRVNESMQKDCNCVRTEAILF
jgi:hypothetical protein